jgi:uncharacterized oligopeptide transporter (OPT) family protein
VAAAVAGLTIVLLARYFQFGEAAEGDPRPVLASPQASLMKALVEGFMSRQPVAYLLFAIGAVIAVVMEMVSIPVLTFALGMYLPLELNSPALVGGFIAHFLTRKSERVGGEAGRSMRERAVIVASGLLAGGALGGSLGAGLRSFEWFREDLIKTWFFDQEAVSQSVSLLAFVALCLYLWFASVKRTAPARA